MSDLFCFVLFCFLSCLIFFLRFLFPRASATNGADSEDKPAKVEEKKAEKAEKSEKSEKSEKKVRLFFAFSS